MDKIFSKFSNCGAGWSLLAENSNQYPQRVWISITMTVNLSQDRRGPL